MIDENTIREMFSELEMLAHRIDSTNAILGRDIRDKLRILKSIIVSELKNYSNQNKELT